MWLIENVLNSQFLTIMDLYTKFLASSLVGFLVIYREQFSFDAKFDQSGFLSNFSGISYISLKIQTYYPSVCRELSLFFDLNGESWLQYLGLDWGVLTILHSTERKLPSGRTTFFLVWSYDELEIFRHQWNPVAEVSLPEEIATNFALQEGHG